MNEYRITYVAVVEAENVDQALDLAKAEVSRPDWNADSVERLDEMGLWQDAAEVE